MASMTWAEFDSQVKQGNTVESLLQQQSNTPTPADKETKHVLDVKIGGTTFQIAPMVPTHKEFVEGLDETPELIIPEPVIPIADLLPLKPTISVDPDQSK